jgi:hypothetical protein
MFFRVEKSAAQCACDEAAVVEESGCLLFRAPPLTKVKAELCPEDVLRVEIRTPHALARSLTLGDLRTLGAQLALARSCAGQGVRGDWRWSSERLGAFVAVVEAAAAFSKELIKSLLLGVPALAWSGINVDVLFGNVLSGSSSLQEQINICYARRRTWKLALRRQQAAIPSLTCFRIQYIVRVIQSPPFNCYIRDFLQKLKHDKFRFSPRPYNGVPAKPPDDTLIVPGVPTVYVAGDDHGDAVTLTLDLYRHCVGRLPLSHELLLCSKETCPEDIDLFLLRLLSAHKKVDCLLFAVVNPEGLRQARMFSLCTKPHH